MPCSSLGWTNLSAGRRCSHVPATCTVHGSIGGSDLWRELSRRRSCTRQLCLYPARGQKRYLGIRTDGKFWNDAKFPRFISGQPTPRVMPCMVPLPDGTFLILNGAVQGVAGFGLANDPNLGALLYDPSMPFNERISILNTTIVARLYHSEVRRSIFHAVISLMHKFDRLSSFPTAVS